MKKISRVSIVVLLALFMGCLSPDADPKGSPGASDTSAVDTAGAVDTTAIDTTSPVDTFTVIDTLPVLDTVAIRASLDSVDLRAAFWPMAVGNRWTYVDSTFSEQGAFVKVDTFTLSLTQKQYDYARRQVWWSFQGGGPIPFPQTGSAGTLDLMQRRDSIFSKEFNNFDPTFLVQAKLIPLPISRDTVGYFWTQGGDVNISIKAIRNNSAYPTPAGNFSGTIRYDYNRMGDRTLTLKSGIGIVGYETGLPTSGSGSPKVSHRARLLEYSLAP